MALEYATVLAYFSVSLLLIIAASCFETQRKEFLPLRLFLFIVGLFLIVKIPSVLNQFVYANDAVNEGIMNATIIENLVRSNETITTTLVRLPYIIMAYFAVWFAFFYVFDWGKKIGQDSIQDWPPLRGSFFKK